ncbi:HIT domain-containing protein [Candidatus Woesearchaeota archaeon]|nr:HIT domain-containing protein [Candidatus Woesearchaeota archaeon]
MAERQVWDEEKIFKDDIIIETEHFSVGQDWEIAIPGFYIVAPKDKARIRSVEDLTDEEATEYIFLVRKVRKAMREALDIKHVYFYRGEDSPFGFHLWMMPRYAWMDKVADSGPGSLLPVWKYAKENLNSEKNIKETKEAAKKMRTYLQKKAKSG